jgi:hypothetical protein
MDEIAGPANTTMAVCAKCAGMLRLIGIEQNPDSPGSDILTFECNGCGAFAIADIAPGQIRREKRTPKKKA